MQHTYELGYCINAGADDPSGGAIGGITELTDSDARRTHLRGLFFQRLFLRGHDALQRWVTWLVLALGNGDHGGHGCLDDLHAALNLALTNQLAVLQLHFG